jgi:hypothetical protein
MAKGIIHVFEVVEVNEKEQINVGFPFEHYEWLDEVDRKKDDDWVNRSRCYDEPSDKIELVFLP